MNPTVIGTLFQVLGITVGIAAVITWIGAPIWLAMLWLAVKS